MNRSKTISKISASYVPSQGDYYYMNTNELISYLDYDFIIKYILPSYYLVFYYVFHFVCID